MTALGADMHDDVQAGPQRCGYVAILGAPNAGKSTLLNTLVGSKLSIVSPKVQTTRARVLGIQIKDGSQILYVDTPGIFKPRRRLDRAMVRAAWGGAADADLIILLVDAAAGITEEVSAILTTLAAQDRPITLVLNKTDAVRPEKLLGLTAQMSTLGKFEQVFMISALTGDGVDSVQNWAAANVPVGHWLYPEDQLSDLPERLLAAEVTREQICMQLSDELPYDTTVETEIWEEREDGSVGINQTIFVRRGGQKAIVLGKGGARIKRIGEKSRAELEALFARRVHLFLFVKLRENWTEDRERFSAMGLDWDEA